MKIVTLLPELQTRLERASIETARLDIFVLMEDALGINRAQLLAKPEMEIPAVTQKLLNEQVARRAQHEPLAYIRGKAEFYGREFYVDSSVLVPRPESEAMVDMLKELVQSPTFLSVVDDTNDTLQTTVNVRERDHNAKLNEPSLTRIADVGTGSGALGITAALELPNVKVDLLEISPDAINTAKRNVIKLTTDVSVIESNLLSAAAQPYDILLCNLPYVPLSYPINQAAEHEPALALFSGEDGLDLYRRLFDQMHEQASQPLLILTEALPEQHDDLIAIAAQAGYTLHSQDDFIQAFQLNS